MTEKVQIYSKRASFPSGRELFGKISLGDDGLDVLLLSFGFQAFGREFLALGLNASEDADRRDLS